MPTFVVPYVEKDKLVSWRAHWKATGSKPDLKGNFGKTELVEANSILDAAQKVEAKYPGCVAITSDISEHR